MSNFNLNKAKKIINEFESITIFDIGAYDFSDSITLKFVYPNSTVYAFEPDSKNLQNFSQAARNYGINVIDAALSDEIGETIFYNSETLNGSEWRCSGSLLKPITVNGTNEGKHKGLFYNLQGSKVRTDTFENFCNTHNLSPSIVHMDVQGAETKVMKHIGKYRPKIIFAETCEFDTYETNTNAQQFDELMQSLGYSIFEKLEYDTFYVYNL
jgi:FkbM family methyltransferase